MNISYFRIADSAKKLYTARKINEVAFDGTKDITVTKLGTSTVGSATNPIYLNAGTPTAGTYTLAAACARGVKSLTSKSHSNYGTNNNYVPDMSFIAYWNGAYSSTNASNLSYSSNGTIIGTNNIKVLTGSMTLAADAYQVSKEIDYPSGFTKDNTVVLSTMLGLAKYGYCGFPNTKFGASNSYRCGVILDTKINLIACPYAAMAEYVGKPISTPPGTAQTWNYKVVLLKL